MLYIIAMFMGFTIIISMVQNARLAQDVDVKQGTLLNFVTGLAGILIYFIITGNTIDIYAALGNVPLLGYIGGFLGVVVVAVGTIVMRKVSVIASAMLMYTGQLLMGIIIDYSRGIELSPGKIIGCVLIVAGVYFNNYVDALPEKSIGVDPSGF